MWLWIGLGPFIVCALDGGLGRGWEDGKPVEEGKPVCGGLKG